MFEDFYLKVELCSEDAKMPTRANDSDVGLDFYTPKDITILPKRDVLIPLDVKTEFPKGYQLRFDEKSGVSTKKKLDIGACIIDPDYRGIVHAHLFNNSDETVYFKKGDKVVQGVVTPVWTGLPIQEKVTLNTTRGEGGFGSTGQ